MFDKVTVGGKTTFEIIGQQFRITKDEFRLLELPRIPEEEPFYQLIRDKITRWFVDSNRETQTRQNVIWCDECITTIQFLYKRSKNYMIISQRSSDFMKLKSDLSFYIELAKKYDIHEIIINFGSLHFILE